MLFVGQNRDVPLCSSTLATRHPQPISETCDDLYHSLATSDQSMTQLKDREGEHRERRSPMIKRKKELDHAPGAVRAGGRCEAVRVLPNMLAASSAPGLGDADVGVCERNVRS